MTDDRSLDVLADLHVEVENGKGVTHMHLLGGPRHLVLEVDDPVQALRAGIGSGQLRTVQSFIPRGAFGGLSVAVRSDGRSLGRVRFTRKGTLRVLPTAAGVRVLGRAGAGSTLARLTLRASVVAAVVAVVVGALRRRS